MDPARMVKESLTSRPDFREQPRPKADLGSGDSKYTSFDRSRRLPGAVCEPLHCRKLLLRDAASSDFADRRFLDVIVDEPSAQLLDGYFPIALRQAARSRIQPQALLSRLGLDDVGALAAKGLVARRTSVTAADPRRSRNTASATPSSIAWLAPWPRCGSIGWAASPSRARRPLVQEANGWRS